MSKPIPAQAFHDAGYRVKKKMPDGSVNPAWIEVHGANGKKKPGGMQWPSEDDKRQENTVKVK